MKKQALIEEELGAMGFFLLALIDRAELTSMYELQRFARLQPGGIRPALQRLEALGFVRREESGARRRRNLVATDEGNEFLRYRWKSCLSEYRDTESVIRAATVALLMEDPARATDYVRGMSLAWRSREQEKSMEADRLVKTQKDALSAYAWMRALSEARRRGAECEAFSTMSRIMKEKHQHDAGQPR